MHLHAMNRLQFAVAVVGGARTHSSKGFSTQNELHLNPFDYNIFRSHFTACSIEASTCGDINNSGIKFKLFMMNIFSVVPRGEIEKNEYQLQKC